MTDTRPLLEVNALKKHFPIRGGMLGGITAKVYAVDGVSFTIARGETLSVVGESAAASPPSARPSCACTDPTDGEVFLDGERIDNIPAGKLRPLRRRMQVVFQDPFSSLNPRMKVRDILAEPLVNFGIARGRSEIDDRVTALMDKVRLPRDAINRFPHEFSGGQRQRIGIARALAPGADLIICDEAVSALDVSVKAQIVNLLSDLQDELGLALLFISHDLAIVEHLTHRVAVMYLGKIVELADRRTLFATPAPSLHAGAAVGGAGAGPDRQARAHHAAAATCRARSTRPPAAASTPAARSSSTAAAPRSRCYAPSATAPTSRPATWTGCRPRPNGTRPPERGPRLHHWRDRCLDLRPRPRASLKPPGR